MAFNPQSFSSEHRGAGLAIVKQTAVERLAALLEREVGLEFLVRELPPGPQHAELLAELEELRGIIKTLKPE